MNLIKTLIRYIFYIILVFVISSCIDTVIITKENPFIIKSIVNIGDNKYKYRNANDYSYGFNIEYIISDVKYSIGDTLLFIND